MFEGSQVSVRIIEGIQIYGKKDAITEMEKIGPKGEGKKKNHGIDGRFCI
jgi:hypothetical protein